ncbi:MAG: Gfo/Idh/MocA family oxidoreductase [Kiritimatiellae bacterium]|nr:Gfo/Idh/MocA family oxidoreductase [Kiritimatiellia bacterium]
MKNWQYKININRRMFATCLLAILVGTAFGVDVAPKSDFSGEIKGRRLKIAAVGSGGMGGAATESLINAGCELVAVCDINPTAFDRWEKKYPGIPKYTDYRVMLREMGDKFEAVQVGTPDHTHAYISVDCMLAGKHVYVQKPLARTVEECEIMLETQRKTGVVVQMGNQGHPGVWRYKAMRDAAVWGEIKEIYSWSDRPIWPQGMKEYPAPQPLPAGFATNAWDCWCGPSENRGFSSAYHSFRWRGWWAYGCGAIGDMAVHNADPAFWALELGLPVKVLGDTCGGGAVTIAYPLKSRIEMTFAPNRWIPQGVKLVWLDGHLKPDFKDVPGLEAFAKQCGADRERKRAEDAKKNNRPYSQPAEASPYVPDNGLIIVGSRATTFSGSHAARPVCLAGDRSAVDAAVKAGDKASGYNHYREFVEACLAKDPSRCGSRLSYAAPLTEALLIGCISLRYPGEELAFDPKALKFTGKEAANEFLKAPRRGEWDFEKMRRGADRRHP